MTRRHNPALRRSELKQLEHAMDTPYLEEAVRVVGRYNKDEHYRLELGLGPTLRRYDWWPSTGRWCVTPTPADPKHDVQAGGLVALMLAHAITFAPATTDEEPCSIECAAVGGCDECLPPDDEPPGDGEPFQPLPDPTRWKKRHRGRRVSGVHRARLKQQHRQPPQHPPIPPTGE